MKTVAKLTLDDARIMMAAAEQKAQDIGVAMDIAIVDDGGNLLMFQRMDGARITSIHIAFYYLSRSQVLPSCPWHPPLCI